jgi:hypothetical protein
MLLLAAATLPVAEPQGHSTDAVVLGMCTVKRVLRFQVSSEDCATCRKGREPTALLAAASAAPPGTHSPLCSRSLLCRTSRCSLPLCDRCSAVGGIGCPTGSAGCAAGLAVCAAGAPPMTAPPQSGRPSLQTSACKHSVDQGLVCSDDASHCTNGKAPLVMEQPRARTALLHLSNVVLLSPASSRLWVTCACASRRF